MCSPEPGLSGRPQAAPGAERRHRRSHRRSHRCRAVQKVGGNVQGWRACLFSSQQVTAVPADIIVLSFLPEQAPLAPTPPGSALRDIVLRCFSAQGDSGLAGVRSRGGPHSAAA